MIVRELPARPTSRRVFGSSDGEAAGRQGGFSKLVGILAATALTELLLVRVFYRVGIYIPKTEPFRTIYRTLTTVGSFAFNLSSVLALVVLGMLAWRAVRVGLGSRAVMVAAFLGAAVLAAVSKTPALEPVVWLTFAAGVLASAVPFVRSDRPRPHRVAVAGVGLALLLASYAGLASTPGLAVSGLWLPLGADLARVAGEVLVVVTALLLFGAWVTEDGASFRALAVGMVPSFALAAAWQANGAVAGILVLWTAGLRLALPLWIYLAALWTYTAVVIGWYPRHPARSAGLVLLLTAGLLLDSTYQQSLALLAVLLLTDGLAVGGLERAAVDRRLAPRHPEEE